MSAATASAQHSGVAADEHKAELVASTAASSLPFSDCFQLLPSEWPFSLLVSYLQEAAAASASLLACGG